MLASIRGSFAQTVATTRWVIGLYFSTAPLMSTIAIIGSLMDPIFSIVWAFIIGMVVDRVINLVQSGSQDLTDFLPFLAIIIAFDLFAMAMNTTSRFMQRIVNRKLDYVARRLLQKHLHKLGVANLESPEVTNRAQRFNEQVPAIADHMGMTISIFSSVIAIVGSSLAVLGSVPEVIPFYIGAIILNAMVNQNGLRKLWLLDRETTEKRRAWWSTNSFLIDPSSLKELLLTGGHSLLRKKYDEYYESIIGETIKIRMDWLRKSLGTKVLQTAAYAFGFWTLLQKTLSGAISIGSLTFQLRMLGTFSSSMNELLSSFVNLRESTVKISDAKELLDIFAEEKDGEVVLKGSNKPLSIEIKNVSFAYPNSTRNVLKEISLTIKPGEKIAIIGENGAGKTTLVKLITRIYQVSDGELLINGTNINKIKIKTWYKKLGVLFQDYNTYSHLTLKENIVIGDVSKDVDQSQVIKAIQRANATDFTNKFEKGMDQILSERFKGGIRPSTGQWQKIAIARFFYRDAPVLILDEPTASIDAVAEAQIFDNIYKFIKNKTVIIISHRFSTVRNADRIIVIHDGQIAEEGTHEELLKLNGRYAKSFNLQARGYN